MGCQTPKPKNCELTCDPANDQCPHEMRCADSGYCVDRDWVGTCDASGDAGYTGGTGSTSSVSDAAGGSEAGGSQSRDSQGLSTMGEGGSPLGGDTSTYVPASAGTDSGGVSGASGASGIVPTAATGGTGGMPQTQRTNDLAGGTSGVGGSSIMNAEAMGGSTIAGTSSKGVVPEGGTTSRVVPITLSPPSPWCVGKAYTGEIAVPSAEHDLTWEEVSHAPGLAFDQTAFSPRLIGTPTEVNRYDPLLRLAGSESAIGALSLETIAAPTIADTGPIKGCVGQVLQTTLVGSDPTPGGLDWTASFPDDTGLVLSRDGQLSGVLQKSGNFEFTVTLRNSATGCTSPTKTLAVMVPSQGDPACPEIRVAQMPAAAEAPSACAAWPYAAQLEAANTNGNVAWVAIDTPAGYDFDSVNHEIRGTSPTKEETITIQITIADGRIIQRRFVIPVRHKCWFGYITEDNGAVRLRLLDPELGTTRQRPTSNATDLSASDFKFSPDGKFVAYRVKDSTGAYRLSLWQGPLWDRDYDFSFDGTVTSYEWSNNSDILAVAFEGSSGTLLGGVNVSGVPINSVGSSIQGLSVLTPIAAAVHSGLTWYGSEQSRSVAFSSPSTLPPSFDLGSQATLAGDHFASPTSASTVPYTPPMLIYPGPFGYFGLDPAMINYHRNGTADVVIHDVTEAVSPSGLYTAQARDTALELRTASADVFFDAPSATARNCQQILTWAKDSERIVCLGADSLLWEHTLTATGLNFESRAVTNSTEYANSIFAGIKRAASGSGNWIALGTAEQLYLADLTGSNARIAWSSALPTDILDTEFSFAPSDALIAVQRGKDLWLFATQGSHASTGVRLGSLVAPPDPCQDDYLHMPNWCGSSRNTKSFIWSFDSRFLASYMGAGKLAVFDLRVWEPSRSFTSTLLTTNCTGHCTDSFGFQP